MEPHLYFWTGSLVPPPETQCSGVTEEFLQLVVKQLSPNSVDLGSTDTTVYFLR